MAHKLFSKGKNAKECCPIACAIQEKFPDKLVSVGWCNENDARLMFHEFFYISVTDPENNYDEIIYSDDKISDLELCSKFAERYDNGDKVKITRETYVDAKDEEDAKLMAYDSLIMGDVDFEIEEDEE